MPDRSASTLEHCPDKQKLLSQPRRLALSAGLSGLLSAGRSDPEGHTMPAVTAFSMRLHLAYLDDEPVGMLYTAPDIVAVDITNNHSLPDETEP